MPGWTKAYVRFVDAVNYRVGRFAMYLLYVLMGVLMWSTISKIINQNAIWTLEMAQFLMVAYYMLGGPYSLQLDSNVRMDLLYHRWSPRQQALMDAISVFALLFFLAVLLYGAVDSMAYALGNFSDGPVDFFLKLGKAFLTGGPDAATGEMGMLERSATAWRPYLWPIKLVMVVGIFLMLLQTIGFFFRDLAKVLGEEI